MVMIKKDFSPVSNDNCPDYEMPPAYIIQKIQPTGQMRKYANYVKKQSASVSWQFTGDDSVI